MCSQFAIRRQGMTLKLASEYTSVFPVTTCWAYVFVFLVGDGEEWAGAAPSFVLAREPRDDAPDFALCDGLFFS